MKRIKRHRVKMEKPETSAAYSREHEEHDLAYYIHDRVELMHQVFSVLKYKDLKAMTPECVRNLPIGDLQELCTEELLGISSKRLLATLDGCEPPSDTESSSGSPTPDQMETISLDSISSDEEILSQASKKKKHKHRRSSKSKSKKNEKHKVKDSTDETTEVSKASRAGLTVLELLELQARARAIRAQLQNEQAKKHSEVALEADATNSTDDEIEIKEEAPDVVEISSGDEKPDITALQAAAQNPRKPNELSKPKEISKPKETSKPRENSKPKETAKPKKSLKSKEISKLTEVLKAKETTKAKEPETNKEKDSEKTPTVTKRISDLIITVPQAKATRKIKLKRNKVTIIVPNVIQTAPESRTVTSDKPTEESQVEISVDKTKKKKKNKKKKAQEKEGSDHDEITLQLSDSEKMDLLEDLNEKNYEKLSASSSDSDSSSSDSDVDTSKETVPSEQHPDKETVPCENHTSIETVVSDMHTSEETVILELHTSKETKEVVPSKLHTCEETVQSNQDITETLNHETVDTNKTDTNTDNIKSLSSVKDDANESSISPRDSIESSNAQDNSKNVEDETVTQDLSENNESSVQDTCMDKVAVSQGTYQNQTVDGDKERQVTDAAVTEKGLPKDTIDKTELTVPLEIDTQEVAKSSPEKLSQTEEVNTEKEIETEKRIEITTIDDISVIREDAQSKQELIITVHNDNENTVVKAKESERHISEGELTDRESSEVEALDIEPEVVCISDDEKHKKKKKKKDKKAKKDKKSKKSKQDFREGADQNFYKDADRLPTETYECVDTKSPIDISDIDDDVYEILELSDDSSCYEVEGTVLSKEPTAEEIEALSARIDEIKREDVVNELTNDSPAENNKQIKSDESEHETENISWKDRYLDSKKVKRVLTTANILNALRKKNKELKKKIEEAKKKEKEDKDKVTQEETEIVLEGSIEQYQLLQASKYVNSVTEHSAEEIPKETSTEDEKTAGEETVTREMKKDAKHLMKMFKKLLNSRKDKRRAKKKKRKLKKQHDGDAVSETPNLV